MSQFGNDSDPPGPYGGVDGERAHGFGESRDSGSGPVDPETGADDEPPNPGGPTDPPGWPAPQPAQQSTTWQWHTPPRPQVHEPRRRRPGGVVLLAAVVALVVGGLAGFAGSRLGARQVDAPAAGGSPSASPSSAPTRSSPSSSPSSSPARSPSSHPSATKHAATGDQTVRIARKIMPSTVTIHATSGDTSDIGSGFAIDDHGRIMTNNHVIADAAKSGKIRIELSNGRRADARVRGRSRAYDLAILQVKKHHGLYGVSFGNSDHTKVGEAMMAVGSPLGLGGTVTEGIVSAVDRPVPVGSGQSAQKKQAYLNAVQTDATINPGNSGGPLVNQKGKVIGVNSAILAGEGDKSGDSGGGNTGLGFAIPIDQARQVAKMLIKHGSATYPVINAKVSDPESGQGSRIAHVSSDGAADHAGLKVKDVITAINGKRVTGKKGLIVRIRKHRPGDTVTLSYRRDGKHHKAKVRLGSERG